MMDKLFSVQEVYVTIGEVVETIDDVKTSLYKTREEAEKHLESLLKSYTVHLENKLGLDLNKTTDDKVKIDLNKEEGYLYFYCEKGNCCLDADITEMEVNYRKGPLS